MSRYNKLNVPYSFKEYYSKYPQGYTIFEALLDWVDEVNKMSEDLNLTLSQWNDLKTWINTELQTYSQQQLLEWLDDGTLEGVINEALFEGISNINTRLDRMAINPDDYDATTYPTDFDKLQQALNDMVNNKKDIVLYRMFDITGNTLIYPKLDERPREMNQIIGLGGGIIKNDLGFMFDVGNGVDNIGELNITGVRFESVEGVGTRVFNGEKIIRIHSTRNYYSNVDTVIWSGPGAEGYLQSNTFINDTIVGGQGWAFDFGYIYDCTIKDCLIEWREHGIGNNQDASSLNSTIRIIDNCIEGLTGTAIKLNTSRGSIIKGNYMEWNGKYVDLTNAREAISVESNVFIIEDSKKDLNVPCIEWGISTLKNFVSRNNYTQWGTLHVLQDNFTFVQSTGDKNEYRLLVNVGHEKQILTMDNKTDIQTTPVLEVTKRSPLVKSIYRETDTELLANEKKTVEFDFGYDINPEDIITAMCVGVSAGSMVIDNVSLYGSKRKVAVFVRNTSAATATASVRLKILQVVSNNYY